jgi:hypothetical protein
MIMSVERKNPLKRDQALNDATAGQIGEEPRSAPEEQTSNLTNERMKTARKMSRDMQNNYPSFKALAACSHS